MLSAVHAVVVCLSIRLFVCVCVCHTAVLYENLSLIHISEPTRQAEISYAVFVCLSLSVRLFVCVCVCHTAILYENG